MSDNERESRMLAGWGATAPTAARVVTSTRGEIAGLVSQAGSRGMLARGLGRSYGDAAQNSGGLVLEPLPSSIEVLEDGHVAVSGGTSFHDLIRALLPLGLFVPVTPGTRYVTVGGAIACDVHGKNHHTSGSLGAHVRSLDIVLADGSSRRLAPDDDDKAVREQFWATVGGMGLTGIITSAVLSCLPVETGHMLVDTERADDLDAAMSRLKEADRTHAYTVAWLDTTAGGRNLGRSVITLGEHAPAGLLPERQRRYGPVLPRSPRLGVPVTPSVGLVTRATTHAFNELWFHKAPRRRVAELQTIAQFFHPLDGVAHWNRVYGGRGLVQYQFVVPDASERMLVRIVERFTQARVPCFLSVLKRFGPANPAPLSFPVPGWTLAVDVPPSNELAPLLDTLDQMVLDAGGRLYLAKDSRTTADTVRQMYPRIDEFRRVRESMDPHRVFRSDLARRLGL